MSLNFSEIYEILGEYKQKALEEYSNYEEKRHQHIGELFKIKKEDPLLGEIVLNGAEPEVIKVALDSFKTLGFFRYGKLIFHPINLSVPEIDTILEKKIFSGVLIESSNLKDKKYIEYFAKKNISILPTTYYFGENYNRTINIGFEYTYDSSDLPIALL